MHDGTIAQARVAMGGIATRPWRSHEAERVLTQQSPSASLFERAAQALLADAKPQSENGFKKELARRCLVQALTHVTA